MVLGDSTGRAGGFVFSPEHGIAVGFGEPQVELADDLRDAADAHGMAQQGIELHLPEAAAENWMALQSTRFLCQHRVQVLGPASDAGAGGWPGEPRHETALLESPADARLETLPRALRAEFAAMNPWPVVVASLAGESIASIASAFVETEAWFDVSIDTVPDFRREGFGASCAIALIQYEFERGKQPVWMVREKNQASLALSQKLGFRDQGRVWGAELA